MQATGARRVSEMVASMGYSRPYVNNVFKACFGVSLKKYSDIIRAQAANGHLERLSVMDAVADLGYCDQAHFIHDFKQYTSLTPNQFIDEICRKRYAEIPPFLTIFFPKGFL